jgi:hypothetical protein
MKLIIEKETRINRDIIYNLYKDGKFVHSSYGYEFVRQLADDLEHGIERQSIEIVYEKII